MAEGTVRLPPDSTGKILRTQEVTVASVVVEQEVVTLARSDGTLDPLPNIVGIWDYNAGNLTGSGSVTKTGRCVGLRVFANGTDSSFNINGGATINVRSGTGADVQPNGQITNPTVNWVSGNIDVFIEVVT